MPIYKVTRSDAVIQYRTWEVEARDEEQAQDIAEMEENDPFQMRLEYVEHAPQWQIQEITSGLQDDPSGQE